MVRIPSRAQVRMTRSAISPRLAIRTERMGRGELSRGTVEILHPVDGADAGHRRLRGADREAQRQHLAGIGRVDQAVVPQPRRAIIWVGLVVEHLAQLLLVL